MKSTDTVFVTPILPKIIPSREIASTYIIKQEEQTDYTEKCKKRRKQEEKGIILAKRAGRVIQPAAAPRFRLNSSEYAFKTDLELAAKRVVTWSH